jgi:multidrug efflux pump subunit AcrB
VKKMSGAEKGGAIAWMARNPVASNLLMVVLLLGGFILRGQTKQEVFPEFDADTVTVSVAYPGASPEEVETGIVLAVEESVRGEDGVKKVTSSAFEGRGMVSVELLLGADANKALQDIKSAVDRITTLPGDAERPVVSLVSNRREVLSFFVFGNRSEHLLRSLAEKARGDLVAMEEITLAELAGVRPLEISVEIPQRSLRNLDLTLDDVARSVARSAVELPGGGVKTAGGEVLLRIAERRDAGEEFGDIPVVSRSDGTMIRLRDVAEIRDGFADTDQATYYNGLPAVQIVVYRVGSEGPLDVAAAVQEYLADFAGNLPDGVQVGVWQDWSDIYRQRINLLLKNAAIGLVLVLIILGLFLEPRLAFWVTLGIPISFLGSFLILPSMDVSINMISLFAFIISLGIVVDDAIVVGENIFECRQQGMPFLPAAITGARLIAVPVTFAILTNIAAFGPLFFVPGLMGKLFRVIPSVVVAVFLVSLVEALFILPAHLGHQRPAAAKGAGAFIHRQQQKFSRLFLGFVDRRYLPLLRLCLRNRYITVAIAISMLIITVGFIAGGRIPFSFMPKVDSDLIVAAAELPFGTPVEKSLAVQQRLLESAREVLARHGGDGITRGILTRVGSPPRGGGPFADVGGLTGGHLANVQVLLVPSDERPVSAGEFARQWRELAGELPGVESLVFNSTAGPSAGSAIDVELSHTDPRVIEVAATELAGTLGGFQGVKDIDKGFAGGKPQLDFTVRPEARSLGLTAADVGRQVRASFHGVEALRQQRGREEIKIMVRLPESERRSEYNVAELILRSPGGVEIPLAAAADFDRGRAYTEIRRSGGRRVINVTADVDEQSANAGVVLRDLEEDSLQQLVEKYSGLSYALEGERKEQSESLGSLGTGFLIAQILIFGLLAIPFKSYIQPLIIMAVIPFGIVGSVIGHVVMGYGLSVISLMGIVALAGVVVNDSLILVDTANRAHRGGMHPFESISMAGVRRFRPIILTSLTTFFGLAPMIFETSLQARFLIPMAISLGFGILFTTFIVLLVVPSLFLVTEDVRKLLGMGEMGGEEGDMGPGTPPGADTPRLER